MAYSMYNLATPPKTTDWQTKDNKRLCS